MIIQPGLDIGYFIEKNGGMSYKASSCLRNMGRLGIREDPEFARAPSESQLLHVAHEVTQIVLHIPTEAADATRLALDMLAERAKCSKLGGAASISWRATVHLLLVDGAPEMIIQAYELLEVAMAQEALVG